MIKISIAVTSYNHAKYLEHFYFTLEEELQFSKIIDYEIIHFDDYSTDNSLELLETIGLVDVIVPSVKNLGVGGNLQRVINYPYTGEIITVISADDYFRPGYFKSLMNEIISVDVLFFNSICFSEQGPIENFNSYFRQRYKAHLLTTDNFFNFNRLYPANFNFKQDVARKIRNKIPDFGLATEWAMIGYLILLGCTIKYSNKTTWYYRISSQSASNSANLSKWRTDKGGALDWLMARFDNRSLKRHKILQRKFENRSLSLLFYSEFWNKLFKKII